MTANPFNLILISTQEPGVLAPPGMGSNRRRIGVDPNRLVLRYDQGRATATIHERGSEDGFLVELLGCTIDVDEFGVTLSGFGVDRRTSVATPTTVVVTCVGSGWDHDGAES